MAKRLSSYLPAFWRHFANKPEFNVAFDEAIVFIRQKINLPSKTWRDIEGRSHDRAFVVAGAMKDALLADLRGEIEKAIEGKSTLADFRKSFDAIVAKHGWSGWAGEGSEAGRAWRTKVIFETNLKTAYAAGRYKQMTDPDIVKVHKWWRYRHGFYREPDRARLEHKLWDGTVLPWNDPWWDKHYPPNGWMCSCGVETLTDRELKAEGIEPDEAPADAIRTVVDPRTGDKVKVPKGIDFGWDHAPGKDWSAGLVPRELQVPLAMPGLVNVVTDLPALSQISRPFKSAPLDEATNASAAVDLFLAEFGATNEVPVLFRDASGHVITISKDLFLRGDGSFKGDKRDRHLDVLRLAETILDPDEIWIDWMLRRDSGAWVLVRRYLRGSPDGSGLGSFTWSTQGWTGSTIFSPQKKSGKPDETYLERQRSGALLWRRAAK